MGLNLSKIGHNAFFERIGRTFPFGINRLVLSQGHIQGSQEGEIEAQGHPCLSLIHIFAAQIADYEERKIIKGYKAIVDWDKTDRDYVNARIELKVTPQKGMGFEEIAEIIARFDEVESVYLMSGTYDIALTVTGKTFKDVAMFVAHRLAPLDSVQSTSTSFVLRTYKELGVYVSFDEMDEREVATPVSYTHLDVYKRQRWRRIMYASI